MGSANPVKIAIAIFRNPYGLHPVDNRHPRGWHPGNPNDRSGFPYPAQLVQMDQFNCRN